MRALTNVSLQEKKSLTGSGEGSVSHGEDDPNRKNTSPMQYNRFDSLVRVLP